MGMEFADFWTRTSGTWINAATVALGTTFGLLLHGRLPERMQRITVQGVGLVTVFIALSMAGSLARATVGRLDGVVLGLLTLVIGGSSASGGALKKCSKDSAIGSNDESVAAGPSPKASWQPACSSASAR